MVAASPFLCMMLSWGNLVVELALPLMVLLAPTKARDEWRRRLTVDVFAASLVLFHLSILVLMGPNFLRMVPLLVLACDPLRREGDAPPARALPITRLDAVRGLVPVVLLAWWWAVQARADYLGVRAHGWAPGSKRGVLRRNPYWPVPLLSMFAVPRRPNFAASAAPARRYDRAVRAARCSTPRERGRSLSSHGPRVCRRHVCGFFKLMRRVARWRWRRPRSSIRAVGRGAGSREAHAAASRVVRPARSLWRWDVRINAIEQTLSYMKDSKRMMSRDMRPRARPSPRRRCRRGRSLLHRMCARRPRDRRPGPRLLRRGRRA